ncbi:DUF6632 domain-containing protein [Microbulbifer spongiae]|uniref:DUF1761 domain-containing protein n=1 Tax=Microbulbifer spongiae TaxID=2944933 RepID=A0ABY9E935_9GAMM|nr:DUF6632 domain-containing protein [Microbulbifer sp. MI-G]WKD48955.1 hypothetical protein M8T91_13780 [Microbulbifer sp. MI-G]
MEDTTRVKYLPIALKVIGLFFIFGVYPMMRLAWPPGYGWVPPYQQFQIIGLAIYATLGVCLIFAARNIATNIGLIWYTIWVNLICGTTMFVMELANRTGEVNWSLNIFVQYFIVGILWYLMPRHTKDLQ